MFLRDTTLEVGVNYNHYILERIYRRHAFIHALDQPLLGTHQILICLQGPMLQDIYFLAQTRHLIFIR